MYINCPMRSVQESLKNRPLKHHRFHSFYFWFIQILYILYSPTYLISTHTLHPTTGTDNCVFPFKPWPIVLVLDGCRKYKFIRQKTHLHSLSQSFILEVTTIGTRPRQRNNNHLFAAHVD